MVEFTEEEKAILDECYVLACMAKEITDKKDELSKKVKEMFASKGITTTSQINYNEEYDKKYLNNKYTFEVKPSTRKTISDKNKTLLMKYLADIDKTYFVKQVLDIDKDSIENEIEEGLITEEQAKEIHKYLKVTDVKSLYIS